MSDLLPHRCYLSKSNHLMYGFLVSVIGLFAYDYESSLWNDDNDPFDSYHTSRVNYTLFTNNQENMVKV